MSDTLRLEVVDAVATITLARPAEMNSVTAALKAELGATLMDVEARDDVRAVVITGEGRAFCVGQDLVEHAAMLAAGDDRLATTVREDYNPIVMALTSMPKPVIAAVNGVAAGAGWGLALAADLRIAAASSSYVLAFGGIGLTFDGGSSWTLQRLAGFGRATELALLNTRISAEQALAWGLVNRVVPDEDLAASAQAMAAHLAAGPTFAFSAMRQSLGYSAGHGLGESLEKEAELQALCGRTADHAAAVQAFLERRQPTFQGR